MLFSAYHGGEIDHMNDVEGIESGVGHRLSPATHPYKRSCGGPLAGIIANGAASGKSR
jgi:hypothetical protein